MKKLSSWSHRRKKQIIININYKQHSIKFTMVFREVKKYPKDYLYKMSFVISLASILDLFISITRTYFLGKAFLFSTN